MIWGRNLFLRNTFSASSSGKVIDAICENTAAVSTCQGCGNSNFLAISPASLLTRLARPKNLGFTVAKVSVKALTAPTRVSCNRTLSATIKSLWRSPAMIASRRVAGE